VKFAWVAVAVALLGCPVAPPPGDVHMGEYAMTASQPVVGYVTDAGPMFGEDGGVLPPPQCVLREIVGDGGVRDDFTFNAVLTRESASARAWVTLSGYSREGTFDGQVLNSVAEANRVFEQCAKCSTRLVETISVAVLSRSQFAATGDQCPENPLDGGVPVNPDAGVVLPGETTQGFDGVRLCGELTTRVVALGLVDGGACDPICDGCTMHYQLRGDRR
jgi:hypothetical protein